MKFPTVQERPVPSGGGFNPIQAQAPDLSAPLKANAQLGETISQASANIGGAVENFRARKDRFNYTIARSKFLQDSINLENEINNDPDFINSPTKYKEKSNELKQKYISDLGNNRFAPVFNEEMGIYEAKKFNDIANSSSQKLMFEQQAAADQITESNLNAFTRTSDPVAQEALIKGSIEAFSATIPDNEPKKPILVQEATKKIGKRFAETALASKSPSEQIAILNQENKKGGTTIAAFMPADQRQEWLMKAETLKERQDQIAIRQAEKAEKLNRANKDKIMIQGVQQGLSFDQLPIEVKFSASREDIERYETLRLQQLGNEGNSDEKEMNFQKYQDLYVKNPAEFANTSLSKIASEVPFSKVDEVQKWHDKAFNDQKASTNISEKVEVSNKFVSYLGLNASNKKEEKQINQFKSAFEQQVNYFKEKNGKEPSKADLEKIGNDLITEKAFEKKGLFGTSTETKRSFQATEQNIAVPENVIEEIQTQARMKGKRIPTETEIKNWYINKK